MVRLRLRLRSRLRLRLGFSYRNIGRHDVTQSDGREGEEREVEGDEVVHALKIRFISAFTNSKKRSPNGYERRMIAEEIEESILTSSGPVASS